MPPHTYIADVQVDFQVGPKQLEWKLSQKLLLVNRICSYSWVTLSGLSGKENENPHRDLKCRGVEDTQEDPRPRREGGMEEGLWEILTRRGQ